MVNLLMRTGGRRFLTDAIRWPAGPAGGSAVRRVRHLSGDFRVERPGLSSYFLLTTCLPASAVLTLLFWLFRR
jgi:hypothetical protein